MAGGYGTAAGIGAATGGMGFLPMAGLKLAGGLMGMLGSRNPYEQYNKRGLGMLQSQYGKPVLNIEGAIGRNRAAMIPRISEMGEGVNRRFGLDSGRGQYALLKMLMEQEGGFNLRTMMKNDQLSALRDQRIAQTLALAGGGR